MKLLLICALALSCHGPAPLPPSPLPSDLDGGAGGDLYDAACAHLRDLGCPEGRNLMCPDIMRRAYLDLFVDFKPRCLLKAQDRSEVRMCGKTVVCAQ